MQKARRHIFFYSALNVSVFVIILLTGTALSLALPKKAISENEKRRLAQLPEFSLESFFNGNYMDSLDYYFADNFPFRDNFIAFSTTLKDNFGIKKDEEVKLYTFAPKVPETVQIQVADTATGVDSVKAEIDTSTSHAEYIKSVFIVDKRAFQLFGGTKRAVHNYAKVVNRYRKELPENVKIFCLAMPTLVDFYLPEKHRKKSAREKPNIDALYEKLDSGVTAVHAYDEIRQHTSEYLFFNTDHHWTGLGAYYAYRAFCASAGFQPYELSQFTHKTIKNFLGSLYFMTLNKDLKENIDSVVYYKFPVKTKAVYYTNENDKTGVRTYMLAEHARGPHAYSVFLGGDYPLIKISSDVGGNRKALLIKDSYGNAFAPYLALHYSEVYIVDYRYFNSSLVDFINKNGITDFIIGHNTFVINNPYTAIRERGLIKGIKPKIKVENDSLKMDKSIHPKQNEKEDEVKN